MFKDVRNTAGEQGTLAPRLLAFVVAVLVSVTLGFSPGATAQTTSSQPSKAERQRAAKLFKEGAEHYFANDYAKALVKFKAAYTIAPNAMIMYNISLTHARIGNIQDALDAAQTARQGKLPKKAHTQNDARITALYRVLEASSTAEKTAEQRARAEAAAKKPVEEETKKLAEEETKKERVEPVHPPPSSIGTIGWTGVGLSVVGAGALAAAGLIEMSLESDIHHYREAATRRDEARYLSLQADIESKQTLGKSLLFGGAGLLVAGSGLIFYDLLDAPESSSRVSFDASVSLESAAVGIGIAY